MIDEESVIIPVSLKVPGRWATFVDQLHTSSVQDCITFYETQINQLLRKHNHGTNIIVLGIPYFYSFCLGPINPAELEVHICIKT